MSFLEWPCRRYAEELARNPDDDMDAARVVRWRYKQNAQGGVATTDGVQQRESNTRLVKWSDGSMQMIVGDERFDVVERNLKSTYLFLQNKPSNA